jgi:hypothetical protein
MRGVIPQVPHTSSMLRRLIIGTVLTLTVDTEPSHGVQPNHYKLNPLKSVNISVSCVIHYSCIDKYRRFGGIYLNLQGNYKASYSRSHISSKLPCENLKFHLCALPRLLNVILESLPTFLNTPSWRGTLSMMFALG